MLEPRTMRRMLLAAVAVTFVAGLAVASAESAVRADSTPSPALFRSFLPGISADSGVTGTPGTNLSPLVATQNVTTWVPGGLWVTGEVHNGLSATIRNVTVTATATGSDAKVVATRTSSVSVDDIGAGQNGPFRVLLAGAIQPGLQVVTSVASYNVAAGPALTDQVSITTSGPRPLEIHTPDPVRHVDVVTISTNLAAIDGTIRNNSAQPITNPQAFVAVYDGAGHVAMLSTTSPVTMPYQGDVPAVLGPGQTGTFTVLVPMPDFNQIQGSTKLVGFLGPVETGP